MTVFKAMERSDLGLDRFRQFWKRQYTMHLEAGNVAEAIKWTMKDKHTADVTEEQLAFIMARKHMKRKE